MSLKRGSIWHLLQRRWQTVPSSWCSVWKRKTIYTS